jgi:acetyl-CoA carboxylase biotin carboxylase subunit
MMFSKLLIANRGEIAVRIIRACKEMGIRTVAVYSEADASAMHVRLADEAVLIGPAAARESYLKIDAILDAARKTGADAIHPGYGFLSERAEFAEAVTNAGLIFVGPPADAIRHMGSKTGARALMQNSNVPIVPGLNLPSPQRGEGEVPAAKRGEPGVRGESDKLGYPILVKASAGGGGKGMRIVRSSDELEEAIAAAQREAAHAFGDDSVFLEKYIEAPRHIEFQVLADSHGNTVHLFERECSIQRRHQKIIEETPSPFLTPELRQRMGAAAIAAAQAVNYVNAGTVEFIVAPDGAFYFLEMNTRLQVEHPITEMVTGLDLVKAQLRIAAGEPLWFKQADLSQRGHAIECRVYAEDPANGFLPSVGLIEKAVEPVRPGIRVDAGVTAGDEVTIHYDPMIAKVIAYGESRADAIDKMQAALTDYKLRGITTNISFLKAVLGHDAFARGDTTTAFIDQYMANWQPDISEETEEEEIVERNEQHSSSPWDRADGFRLGVGMAGWGGEGASSKKVEKKSTTKRQASKGASSGALEAAMPGQVRGVLVSVGDTVEKGQALALLEAMKMEIRVAAPQSGKVLKVLIQVGDVVERGQQLFEIG